MKPSQRDLGILRHIASGPTWTITMMPDTLKAANRLKKLDLIELVDRPPTRAGNLRGADYVITPKGKQLLKSLGLLRQPPYREEQMTEERMTPDCQGDLDEIISDAAANPIEIQIKKGKS